MIWSSLEWRWDVASRGLWRVSKIYLVLRVELQTIFFVVYDSWGKISSGLLQGNFFTPGSFEQCRRFGIQNSAGLFQGQHCTVQLGITAAQRYNMIPLWLGICVPDSCGAPFVRNLTNQFALQSGLGSIGFANQANFCYRDEPNEQFSGTAISAM